MNIQQQKYIPLEEWAKLYAPRMTENIEVHLKAWGVEEPEGLRRLMLGAVRDWITFEQAKAHLLDAKE